LDQVEERSKNKMTFSMSSDEISSWSHKLKVCHYQIWRVC